MKTSRIEPYLLPVAWTISVIGLLGSLFLSNVLGYVPCELCWLQRICLYPLVVILLVGMIRRDTSVYLYALPLALIGTLISVYHNVIYDLANYGHRTVATTCTITGPSCTTPDLNLFGFVSIPLLSLGALLIVTICLVWYGQIQINKRQA